MDPSLVEQLVYKDKQAFVSTFFTALGVAKFILRQ
jgi:hypothetical protein